MGILNEKRFNRLPIPKTFNDTKSHMKCFKELDYNFEKNCTQYHKENNFKNIM